MNIKSNELDNEKDITWDALWQIWKEREKGHWEPHWRERGFITWHAWRELYLVVYGYTQFKLDEGAWKVSKITDPVATVPKILTGPLRGWAVFHDSEKRESYPFADVAKSPKAQKNAGITRARKSLSEPGEFLLFGLYEPANGTIMLMEGHHHAAAIALMAADGETPKAEIRIALLEIPPDLRDKFEEMAAGDYALPEGYR